VALHACITRCAASARLGRPVDAHFLNTKELNYNIAKMIPFISYFDNGESPMYKFYVSNQTLLFRTLGMDGRLVAPGTK
jgi:hypothetical protein